MLDPAVDRSHEVWARFRQAPTTLGPTPGERERWRRGRSRYAVWVARIDDARVRDRMAEAQRVLAGEVRPVALDDAHVTSFVAGFPAHAPAFDDDVSEGTLTAQAAALAAAVGRFPLRIGALNAFPTCAILDVADPAGGLGAARAALARHAAEVRFAPYHPHVTVGSFVATRPTAPLVGPLASMRDLEPIDVHVDALELVELDAATEGPRLETRWCIPLTGLAPAA